MRNGVRKREKIDNVKDLKIQVIQKNIYLIYNIFKMNGINSIHGFNMRKSFIPVESPYRFSRYLSSHI